MPQPDEGQRPQAPWPTQHPAPGTAPGSEGWPDPQTGQPPAHPQPPAGYAPPGYPPPAPYPPAPAAAPGPYGYGPSRQYGGAPAPAAGGQRRPPAGPARSSKRRNFLIGAGAGVPVLGALGFLASRLGRGEAANQAGGGGGGLDPNDYNPSTLPTAAANPDGISTGDIQALIATANQALKTRDEKGFVAAYASGASAQASRMFANLGKFEFDYLQYELIGDGTREFGSGSATSLGVDVALVHQLTGVDVTHVAEWYRWTVSKAGAGAPVVIESVTGSPALSIGGARYVYYPSPWDATSELTVIKQGQAILCAQSPADAALLQRHAAEAAAALQANSDGWRSAGGKGGVSAGALMMGASNRTDFYRWFSGSSNTYGNEAGLTIPMVSAESLASGSTVITYGSSRITLDLTSSYFTTDQGEVSARVLIAHEDAHKLIFTLMTATQQTVPLWAVEGFADYMATRTSPGGAKAYFRNSDIKAYAAGQTPSGAKWDGTLPTDDEVYDKADSTVGSAGYGLGAMAFYYIDSLKGLAGAIAFITAVYQAPTTDDGLSNGTSNLAGAFQSVLGLSEDQFVAGWLGYIKAQIGVSAQ